MTVTVFEGDSKRTHIGEIDGSTGSFGVVPNSGEKLMVIVRPVP